MSATVQLMGSGGWELAIDAPWSLLTDIKIETRLWSTFVHTRDHWAVGELSDDELLSQARYCGVYLSQGQDRLDLSGEGLEWWLGDNGDGGEVYSGVDVTTPGFDLAAHLDNSVFITTTVGIGTHTNGLQSGAINNNATTFTVKQEGGDTRGELLDTIIAQAPGGPYYYRINDSDFTIDVDTLATLWPSTTTPTVLLTDTGGMEGDVFGVYAELGLDNVDGSEVRSRVFVDYDNGTANGSAVASLPATYVDLIGEAPANRTYMDWRPKRPRPPTERWRKVAAWGVAAQARADTLASREVNERAVVRPEITARCDGLTDPWRYDLTPGNTVYLDDPEQGLINLANKIPYRGEIAYPTTGRVDEMTVPFGEDGGYYLRCWDGVSAFEYIDLTDYVVPETGPVELKLNQRTRFPIRRSRPRRLTRRDRRRWRARARTQMRFQRYLDSLRN